MADALLADLDDLSDIDPDEEQSTNNTQAEENGFDVDGDARRGAARATRGKQRRDALPPAYGTGVFQ